MFGSFLPSLLVGSHHQAYSGPGADIVMESITLIENRSPLLPSDDPQKLLGANEFGEQFFLFLKLPRVHASPTPTQLDRVLQVQHFVVENVFDGIARHAWVVEDTADYAGVGCRFVVAEAAAGMVLAPGELRASHESVEEAAVEVVEDFFQMIVMAAGRADVLASADLEDEPRFRSEEHTS